MASFAPCSATLVLALAIVGLVVPSCVGNNILYTNEILYTGQSLSLDSYAFTMQDDCNLVLYDAGRPVWATNTGGQGSNCYLKMQSDGNVVVYSGDNRAIWSSNTNGEQGYYILVLQKDRNVVSYGGARWATASNRVGGISITSDDTASASLKQAKAAAEPNVVAMVV